MPPLDNPRVGIVIPTFNRVEYLKQALCSALRQTYAEIAILVIDNGSTDGTGNLMSTVLDPRVRYVVNESNLGPAGNIRRGISHFAGRVDWATVLCDDDLLDANFVATMLEAVRRFRAASVVHSHRVFVDPGGNRIREAANAPEEESAFDYLINRARRRRETYLTGVLFRLDAYEAIGGFPSFATGMASDDALIFALALLDRLVFEERAVAAIRIHPGAESLACTGTEDHFRALADFSRYVERTATAIGRFDGTRMRALRAALGAYVRDLDSELWLRGVEVLMRSRENPSARELRALCDAARGGRYPFRARIRTDALLIRATGRNPESLRLYRSAWKRIEQALYGR